MWGGGGEGGGSYYGIPLLIASFKNQPLSPVKMKKDEKLFVLKEIEERLRKEQ